MEYNFIFSPEEKNTLVTVLNTIPASPYLAYPSYMKGIKQLINDDFIPRRFLEFCAQSKARNLENEPIVVIGNCPIDKVLPIFDEEDPVQSKYQLKKTFVAEGFLALYAVLNGTTPIAHKSVNQGDFFHDIYPKKSMQNSQSQKTLETLRFHKDFTNHFAIPDFVVTLTLRDTPENEIYSTFAINNEVIRSLSPEVKTVLQQEQFYTPFDDVSTQESQVKLGRARNHATVIGDFEIKVFEGRTVGITPDAQEALNILIQALHDHKLTHIGKPGDSIAFANNYIIHGRELKQLRDRESLKHRWLMKTHNVYSLSAFEQYFLPQQYGVING